MTVSPRALRTICTARRATPESESLMSNPIVTLVTVLACLVVAVILFMGLWNMFKGGDPNRSQMLMRARVVAQFVALVVLLGALLIFGRGPQG